MTIKKGFMIAICAVVVLIAARKFFADPWTASECDKLEKALVASPDGSRLAKHVFFACGAGLTEEVWDAVVVLQSEQAPRKGDEVWIGSIYHRDKIDFSWQSADRLLVTLPNESETFKQKASGAGVMIEYRFDPDDPLARQEYSAKRNSR